jgi:F-type H+-transporting ATPase subunit b
MIIDWYTIIFQIINFLVLVFLLRLFLYGPIIRMMDERERRIVEREEEATALKLKAEEESDIYNRKTAELEEEKEMLLEKARTAAGEEKHELLQKARSEVEQTRKRWEDDFEREKETFIDELRRRIARQACTVARRCLEDLADTRLEALTWNFFLEKAGRLPDEERAELEQSIASADHEVILRTAFDPPEGKVDALKKDLEKIISVPADGLKITTKTDPNLICGLELDAGDYSLAWSIDSYLDDIEKEIIKELDRKVPGTATEGVAADGTKEE